MNHSDQGRPRASSASANGGSHSGFSWMIWIWSMTLVLRALTEHHAAVAFRRDGLATRPIGRGATLILQHPADITPIDIGVDARHPGIDQCVEHSGREFLDMPRP